MLSLAIISCTTKTVPDGFSIDPTGARFFVGIGGRERSGALHVPSNYDNTRTYSLILALHGANNSGETFRRMGFDQQADILDFIVVYPDGDGMRWDSPEDIPFFQIIIDGMKQTYRIDPKRIYITGHSAGSVQAYEAAAVLSDTIAAIAPVAGLVMSGTTPVGIKPVSVLHIQAHDDPEMPFGGAEEWGVISARDSIALWKKINGAKEPGESFYENGEIHGTVWRGNADTAILEYDSGRHTWLPLATEFVCDFFYNHPARENRIMLKREELPRFAPLGDPIFLKVSIADPSAVSRVEYYAQGKIIGESSKEPFSFEWTNPAQGLDHISARAFLKNGAVVSSTFNPSVIVARPTLAVDIATSSSDEVPGIAARYAIDGNVLTRWSSMWTDDEYIELDLGRESKVSGVSLFWEMAYARAYTIDVSLDRETWATVHKVEDNGKGGEEFIDFPPIAARYVRMTGLSRATEYGYSLWEFNVHGE